MRRIAVINQKGGVGKTTSCCNIGAMIAAAGHRVLLIDLDPQAHLTMHLGVEPDGDKPSLYNVLTDNLPLADAAVEVRENLTLVPSHIDLAAAEMELVSVMGREVILRDALQQHTREFDFMLIDCPPSLGVLTINGLAAVNEIVVPMQPHFLALQGVGKLLETIGLVKSRINPELKVSGIILCMYEAGTRLAGEVAADLASFLEQSRNTDVPWAGAVVYQTIIRRNIKLAECPSHGQTIAEYAPQSNGAVDYAAVTDEILGVKTERTRSAKPRRAEQAAPVRATEVTAEAPLEEPVIEVPAVAAEAPGVVEQVEERPEPIVAEEPVPAEALAADPASAATREEEPVASAFDAGDRTVYGPDSVEPAPSVMVAEAPDKVVPVAAEPRGPAAPPVRIGPRRSIPVFYEEDEVSAPAATGSNRE